MTSVGAADCTTGHDGVSRDAGHTDLPGASRDVTAIGHPPEPWATEPLEMSTRRGNFPIVEPSAVNRLR